MSLHCFFKRGRNDVQLVVVILFSSSWPVRLWRLRSNETLQVVIYHSFSVVILPI